MGPVTKSELVPLLRKIDELLAFMHSLGLANQPYFVKFIERMKYNIQTCITVRYDGWEQMDRLLKRDWKEANHMLLGIPDFEIPADNSEDKHRLSCQFLELIGVIDMYING